MPEIVLTAEQAELFWSRVDRRGPDECWNWTRPPRDDGYVYVGVCNGVNRYAHRIAYTLANPGVRLGRHDIVRHTCDNRRCCNPAHLRLGTQADNIDDKVAKGRQARGAQIGSAKVTDEVVRELVAKYAAGGTSSVKLAREYGLSKATVLRILRGEYWAHVERPNVADLLESRRRSQPQRRTAASVEAGG